MRWSNWLRTVCRSTENVQNISYRVTDNTRGAIEKMIPLLIWRLDDEDPYVRGAVVNAMVELAKNGV
jgi:hypothetical protein